ncbi:MAG: ABC transporter permease [Chloroflexi bacterium]|nr:ABC transporter permease [Chloroflexota bacterium]MCY3583064.1 ABC transporter permease [Chloroflexota bacterium]MCY3716025.1 ABC transporter permease [Chloroflexota bacterium]MDE2652059.1 ABC transporter permease [Chloroflexota bacterium]MXV93643.1 ABC transporter permease [Chloroflexota bacterium]
MIKYIIRRLIQSIPIFFGITILSYLLLWLAPGSVIERLYFAPNIKAETRAKLAAQLGIDDPFHIQYLRWLAGDDWLRWDSDGDGVADGAFEPLVALDEDGDGIPEPRGDNYGILRGDFGISFIKKQPVMEIIMANLPATLELGMATILTSMVIGIPVGVLSAVTRGRRFDNTARVMSVIFDAIPNFWLGYILIFIFGSWLGILPIGGRCTPNLYGVCPSLFQRINYLLLPTVVFAAGFVALYSRYVRTSTLEVLNEDYIRTARAKGLSPQAVNFRHAMRNAMIPVATLLGPIITNVWAGALVIETVFAWPGVGRIAFTSAIQQDHPVVMGIVIIASLGTILGFLLSDILYVLIDPRIRLN